MPGCVRSTFSEPEDFEIALRQEGYLGLLITGRGQFQAQLTQITLHEQRVSAAEEQLSRIAFVAVPADTVLISFAQPGGRDPVWGGIKVRPDEIAILGPGESLHVRSGGPYRWGAIRLPQDELVRYGSALTGVASLLPLHQHRWRPRPMADRHLRHLHAAAIRMARVRPQAVIDAKAAHGLEQQLIHALIECLAAGPIAAVRPSARRHQEIMVRFEHLLQSQPDRRLPIPEISEALGVSERQLRSLCAEHLGMSPTRYDRLRRMWRAHSMLRRADCDVTGVSEVARRHGFRDLGRFAVNYRAAFGEFPSTTLRRGHETAG
jgi:AraC-like DNA-binding protein